MPRIFVYFACCCSFTLPRARAEGEGLSGEGVHRGIAQQGRERKTDCRDEGKQSAQELANELSCGNPLRPPNLRKMLLFEKHAQLEQGNKVRLRAKTHAQTCGPSLSSAGIAYLA